MMTLRRILIETAVFIVVLTVFLLAMCHFHRPLITHGDPEGDFLKMYALQKSMEHVHPNYHADNVGQDPAP